MANDKDDLESKDEDQDQDDVVLEDIGDDDSPEVVKEKAQKAIELARKRDEANKQLFARTKKAEGFVLKDGKWVKPDKPPTPPAPTPPAPTPPATPEAKDGLSTKDTMALVNAKIHEDDIQEVLDYAKFKGISVSEALKNDVVRTTLKTREEQRQTAAATHTGKGGRPGSAAPSGKKLLEEAQSSGNLPDTDEGIQALVDARMGGKK